MAILADLTYSARSLARAPGLALALLLTIALGIGANASVLGFIRGSVTRDLPLPDAGRIVSVFAADTFGPLSYDAYLAIERLGVFDSTGAARESQATVEVGGRSAVLAVAAMTPGMARLLGLPADDGVILSDRAWRTDLGAGAGGQALRLDGRDVAIAGLAPDWLTGLYTGSDVGGWTLLREDTLQPADRRSRTFWVLARLREGMSPAQAQAALDAARSGTEALAVTPYTGVAPEAAGGAARVSRLLPAAAGAVLVIACVNVAAFLLSRAFARAHETSVRVALGAGRRQLGSQLLSDSVLISAAGGACGVLLAWWTARIIPALFFQEDAAHLGFSPDAAAIALASAACGAITVACGLMPLFEVRADDPAAVLRRESSGPSAAMRRVRAALVMAQMTCCCVLVISAALLLQGFRNALRTSTGHQLGSPILVTVEAARRFYRPDLGLEYFRRVEGAAQSVPGIFQGAWVSRLPGGRPAWDAIRVEPPDLPTRDVVLDVAAFTPRSLDQVVLPPVAGRMFGGRDTRDSCTVGIVNEEAAAVLFDGSPVGRAIHDGAGRPVEIVGVIAARRPEGSAAPGRPTIYYYAEQGPVASGRTETQVFRVPVLPRETAGVIDTNVVTPGYFDVLGASVVAGTLFRAGERPGPCRVAVVNEEAAELYFGGRAVGGAVVDGAGRRTAIAGVIRSPLLRATQRLSGPAIYFPLSQDFLPRMTLILGAREAGEETVEAVRGRVAGVDGGRGPATVTTLDAHLGRTALAAERIAMLLVGAAAAMALALAGLGLYGAMAEAARHRRREIAVRLALGAQRWRVIGHVLSEGLRLAGVGTAAGFLASLLVARWLARAAPGTGDVSRWVWLAAPLALLAAVAVASVLPARRALSIDPLTIMRDN